MATLTPNLKLTKPDQDEFYDVQVFNTNADIIDNVGNIFQNSVDEIDANMIKSANEIKAAVAGVDNSVKTNAAEIKTAISGVDNVVKTNTADIRAAITGVDNVVKTNTAEIRTAVTGVDTSVRNNSTEIRTAITGVDNVVKTNATEIRNAITGVDNAVKTNATEIRTAITGVDTSVRTNATEIRTAVTGVDTSVKNMANELKMARIIVSSDDPARQTASVTLSRPGMTSIVRNMAAGRVTFDVAGQFEYTVGLTSVAEVQREKVVVGFGDIKSITVIIKNTEPVTIRAKDVTHNGNAASTPTVSTAILVTEAPNREFLVASSFSGHTFSSSGIHNSDSSVSARSISNISYNLTTYVLSLTAMAFSNQGHGNATNVTRIYFPVWNV
ncbi:MAG: hypothetical protein FWE14_09295 [Lachnospiraceae bacterium]|nr:hypothetical protein [Lachnospiraceae bacterium]